LSGQLYSLAIGPLLFKLRDRLSGFNVPGLSLDTRIYLSAYADDITVFVNNSGDINCLSEALTVVFMRKLHQLK